MSIKDIQKHKTISPKRRALIKGSATVAPMVLTLRSGAAFAADSAGACVARTQDNPPSPRPDVLVENNNLDNWVRVVTTGRYIKLIKDNGVKITGSTPFMIFRDPEKPQDDPEANYFRVTDNTLSNAYFKDKFKSNGDPTNKMKSEDGNKIYKITNSVNDCQVLCFVDRNGNPFSPPTYGADFGDGKFPFATTSCIASIV